MYGKEDRVVQREADSGVRFSEKERMSFESKNEWREQSRALFFIDHVGINEISLIVNKARETVSRFIRECDGYDQEMMLRKRKSVQKRKEYQRQWDRDNRSGASNDITKESLRWEHEVAVRVLSSEKY